MFRSTIHYVYVYAYGYAMGMTCAQLHRTLNRSTRAVHCRPTVVKALFTSAFPA